MLRVVVLFLVYDGATRYITVLSTISTPAMDFRVLVYVFINSIRCGIHTVGKKKIGYCVYVQQSKNGTPVLRGVQGA